jgi:site-specific recombinase XerD
MGTESNQGTADMPRTPKGPWYWEERKGYYATIGGKRIWLATGSRKEAKKEAQEQWDAHMRAYKVEVAGDKNTVWALVNRYLVDAENRVKNKDMSPATLALHRYVLLPFVATEKYAYKLVRDLRPQDVDDWLAEMRQPRWSEHHKRKMGWNDSTVKKGRDALRRVMRWAQREQGLISRNPLEMPGKHTKAKLRRRRPVESRAAITEHEHALLLEQAKRRTKKDFFYLIQFLKRTGARPAEMYGATAAEWREEEQAFIIRGGSEGMGRFKLAYLGEDRTIYIPADLVPIARQLMGKYPEGPIFRSESGAPWKNNTLCARFSSIKKAANRAAKEREQDPIRKEIKAYSYRHAFVTDWVTKGRPLLHLCELLNTSEAMIRSNYNHLFKKKDVLRATLNEFDAAQGEQPLTGNPAAAASA